MNIRFVEEARSEFLDAISYYEGIRSDLGQRFRNEVDRRILWIADHPEFYHLRPGGYRRINCRVFPYYVAYIVRGFTLWILAVGLAHRQPEYWINRRPKEG